MSIRENVVCFGLERSLVGIISAAESDEVGPSSCGVVFMNANFRPRIGPRRWYVKMARRFAASGFPAMRFDQSGIGDSLSRIDNVPYDELVVEETQAAMDRLCQSTGVNRFVLIGLCQGANAALRVGAADTRVIGAVLINGMPAQERVRKQVATQMYNSLLRRRIGAHLFNWNSWRRIMTRRDDKDWVKKHLIHAAKGLVGTGKVHREELAAEVDWQPLLDHGAKLLLVFSEGSPSLDAYRIIHGRDLDQARRPGEVDVEVISKTDHQFTPIWSQNLLIGIVHQWLLRSVPVSPQQTGISHPLAGTPGSSVQ